MNDTELAGRADAQGSIVPWAVAAVVLALVCAGLIGVNLARWQDSRDAPADPVPVDADPASEN